MSVFKWEPRKGWDVLLDAYVHEFSGSEPVELHIMTKPFGKGDQVRLGRMPCRTQTALTKRRVVVTIAVMSVVTDAKVCHMHLRPTRRQRSVDRHALTVVVGVLAAQDTVQQVQSWLHKRLGIQRSQIADLPRVYVHTAFIDDATYRRLYSSADCVVLPTRY